jgi:hypothetical protein
MQHFVRVCALQPGSVCCPRQLPQGRCVFHSALSRAYQLSSLLCQLLREEGSWEPLAAASSEAHLQIRHLFIFLSSKGCIGAAGYNLLKH